MSKPRQVFREQFYLLTRRCTQRQFFLRPDDATNNAFIYCLAVAAARFNIAVLVTVAESNHHHTVIFDRDGRCSEFLEYFHKLVARSQNAYRGRWENFWASEAPCVTRLLDRQAVIAKMVYAATNPVKDRLVERVHHWPGVNTYVNLCTGRPLTATRPHHFFRKHGSMPAAVTLEMTIPPELGPAEQVIVEVRAAVEQVERDVADARKQTGARVMGRRAVLAQPWNSGPTSVEPRRTLRPRFAGGVVARMIALLGYRGFLDAYREARAKLLVGTRVEFPPGTYWLARFAGVAVAL